MKVVHKNNNNIGKNMSIDKLTDMDYTLKGNKESLDRLYKDGMQDFSVYTELTKEDDWDGYHVSGDMINHFMLTHPKLKDGCEQMSADERWIFTEAMFYGIEQLIKQGMGFVQQ